MNDSQSVLEQIQNDIANHKIILYMKGDKHLPQCGFSARVVQILSSLDIDYETRNVLLDDELRQSIKEYSDWPTIPQLYVAGEFIGGCDVVSDMYEKGQLQELLKEAL